MKRIKFADLPKFAEFYNADDFDCGRYVALLKESETEYRVRDQFGSPHTLANLACDCYLDPCQNLDGIDVSELDEIASGEFDGWQRAYAQVKASAIRARLAGPIDEALKYERECERIYSSMPYYLKW